MDDVIDFFFYLLSSVWDLILSNWIFSAFFLIFVLSLVISLVNHSQGNDR